MKPKARRKGGRGRDFKAKMSVARDNKNRTVSRRFGKKKLPPPPKIGGCPTVPDRKGTEGQDAAAGIW